MCSSPEGYGSISTTYVLASSAWPGSGFGVWNARASSQTRCQRCSISLGSYRSVISCLRVQKSLSLERPWEAVAALRRGGFLLYGRSCFTARMLALFPLGTSVAAGELELEGLAATELAERFGTPLVVYSEAALRERARMFRRAVPEALVVYGTKAFPNVAVMRLLAEEGLGADVADARRARLRAAGRDRRATG